MFFLGGGGDFPDERSPSWVNIQVDHTQLQKETNWGFIVYRFRVWTVQTVLCSEVEHWLNLQLQGLEGFRNQSSSPTKVTNPMVTTTPFNLSPLNKSDWIDNKRCFSFVHQYSVFVFVFCIFQMYWNRCIFVCTGTPKRCMYTALCRAWPDRGIRLLACTLNSCHVLQILVYLGYLLQCQRHLTSHPLLH